MLTKNDNPKKRKSVVTLDELANRYLQPDEKQAVRDADIDMEMRDAVFEIKYKEFFLHFYVHKFSLSILLAISITINVLGCYIFLFR